VLAAGPHVERRPHDFAAAEAKNAGDLDITEVGRDARMPWEVDGRRWHTRERVDRKGEPCRWDGRVLERVVDRVHELGEFSETNWNARSVVEISAAKKSDGWFFHAITGETWLLKLKFRVAKNHFKGQDLTQKLALKTLNEIDELPIYSNEPRVKCKNLRGPWQEVEMRVHTLEEIDSPDFWQFLEGAVEGFSKFTDRVAEKPEDIMPWKKLGQKWHLLRKGFPPGQKIRWEVEVLEELIELLTEVAPDGQFLWNNQVIVHLMVPARREPWATIHTKRPGSVDLTLTGPKGRFGFGRVADLGCDRSFDGTRDAHDQFRLSFRTTDDLHRGDLVVFLREHLAALNS
jgi:excinuclease ABC subunit A